MRSNLRLNGLTRGDDQLDIHRRSSSAGELGGTSHFGDQPDSRAALERGITIRKVRRHAEAALPQILEDPDTNLSGPLRMLLAQLQQELRQLQSQIDEIDAAS